MPTLKGIRCELVIAREKAIEYGLEEVNETQAKVHVVAVSNAKYRIAMNFPADIPDAFRVLCNVWVDGMKLVSGNVYQPGTGEKIIKYAESKGRGSGEYIQRRLRFGNLETVDTPTEAGKQTIEEEKLDRLGTIRVEICRAKEEESDSDSWDDSDSFDEDVGGNLLENDGIQPLHEELVKGKGITHTTKLGMTEKTKTYDGARCGHLDPPSKPYVIFIFRYTTKSLLQAEKIIPKNPSPERFDHDLQGMDLLQAHREIMKLRKEMEEQTTKIKDEDEQKDTVQEDQLTLVYVPETRASKRRRIEVIDLTADD